MSILRPKIAIIYYSTYGHVHKLAQTIQQGITSTGATASLYQVPETLPESILKQIHAPKKPDVPVATLNSLTDYDGVLFGFPTRYGMMASQMKAFLDGTGGLWVKQSLAGKPAGFFFSTAAQGGGQETTAFTAVTQLTHQGMVYVPLGYAAPGLNNMDEIHGGSPWGAGSLAKSDGSRQVSQLELETATIQGKSFANFVTLLVNGRKAVGKL